MGLRKSVLRSIQLVLDRDRRWPLLLAALNFRGLIPTSWFIKKNPTRCNNVSKFYYSIFIWSSTCFGRHTAHHQEPKLHRQPLVFDTWKVVGRVVGGHCEAECAWQRPPTTRPTTFHAWKPRGCQCSFRLLMMGGVLPETCWASYKYGIIKFWYIVESCWIFLYELYYDARIHERQTNKSVGLQDRTERYSCSDVRQCFHKHNIYAQGLQALIIHKLVVLKTETVSNIFDFKELCPKLSISLKIPTDINPTTRNLHGPNTTNVTQWFIFHLQDRP